jgi:hypothetical protein
MRRFLTVCYLVAPLMLAGASQAMAQSATTATVTGRVVSETQAPLAGVQVVVRNAATGLQRGSITGSNGRFIIPLLPPGGPYSIETQFIGHAPVRRNLGELSIGENVTLEFELTAQAVVLEGVTVDATPLVEATEGGVIDRVSQTELESLPTNGRNFADFIVLAPGVQPEVGDGSGGNISLGGGRRGATNIQIDGVGNSGTFFGGEARGSDRIAFAFSVETVKEFQVLTNAYDVEHGNFTGGIVNAVTKSGTNEFEGSAFFYRRDESLTGNEFVTGLAPQDFESNQLGFTLGGPIVRDKAHFFFSIDRQDRSNPIQSIQAPNEDIGFQFGIHPDSLQRVINILENVYGVQNAADQFGTFSQTNNQTAIFGRVDWQLNDRHTLTLRNNYTDLKNENDRISRNEARDNGGNFIDEANSFVANLKSILAPNLFNDFRIQYATEHRPRPAYSNIPQVEIDIRSDFGARGTTRVGGDLELFNDPVLPNSLDENTVQLVNNLVLQQGTHTFKVGTNASRIHLDNFFFFNQFGEFEFDSIEDFEMGTPSQFDRSIPGASGEAPRGIFDVYEIAFYAQDDWDVTRKLNVNYGLRYDVSLFPDAPPTNQAVLTDFGIDTNEFPTDLNNISPRVGIAYDVDGDSRSVVRAGAGVFYGRIPSVFWSNAILNTGESQGFVRCTGGFDPAVVQSIIRGERPAYDQCPGGGFAFSPNVNGFQEDLQWPYAIKANLGYDRAVTETLRVGVDLVASLGQSNFYNIDANVDTQPEFFTDNGLRPVFAPLTRISAGSGRPSFGSYRVDRDYNDVIVTNDEAESRTWQLSFEADKRFGGTAALRASYTVASTYDNSSSSCCISSTAIFETPTAGNLNFLGDPGDETNGSWGPADFDRRHSVIFSGLINLPYGVNVSGIYRGASGLPFTPVVDGDVNADGRSGNDRAFLPSSPSDLNLSDPADAAVLQDLYDRFECLNEQRGRIATRNNCRNPWVNRLDARVAVKIPTTRGQGAELIADVFNVLNLIDDSWGQDLRITDNELLEVEGFNPVTQQFEYSVNPNFGEERPFGFSPRQWQVQLGVRYEF